MTDYTKLVKALRHCSYEGIVKCNECKYSGKEWPVGCEEELMKDAAAAIEELQAEVKRLEPKRGEWIMNDNGTWSCSLCQSWIPNQQHYYARYCLCCGAKMEDA